MASPHSTLVNAQVQPSGAIVATSDDFVIAGQTVSVNGEAFYTEGGDSYVIYNNGYSGRIAGNTLNVASVSGSTFGVQVAGGNVTVEKNVVAADEEVNGQFIGVGFSSGVIGSAKGNEITGSHRVGVLAVDEGTEVTVSDNTIEGPGPRMSGWADNGVQISGGATGVVKDNVITDHWYAPNSFVSAGLLCFSDGVVVQRNQFVNNDTGVGVIGGSNNVVHNTVEVTYAETDTEHFGVLEYGGQDNGIRQNTITTEAAANGMVGIVVLGKNTKLIRNSLSGWEDPILAPGDGTKLPKPFVPVA